MVEGGGASPDLVSDSGFALGWGVCLFVLVVIPVVVFTSETGKEADVGSIRGKGQPWVVIRACLK